MAFNILAEVPCPVHLSEMGESFAQPGIYFLWQGEVVVYVGQSKHVTNRILKHAVDKLKTFDGVSSIPCPRKALLKTERYFIEALLPKYNRCGASEFIRKVWVGHTEERPMPDRRVGLDLAASILGVTVDQLRRLYKHGLECRRIRTPRARGKTTTFSVRDLHQFAAQKPDAIIAACKKDISPFARR